MGTTTASGGFRLRIVLCPAASGTEVRFRLATYGLPDVRLISDKANSR